MPPEVLTNSTTPEHRSAAAVENIGDEGTQLVTIGVSLSVVAMVVGICAVVCYREVNRRRKETLIVEEFARRASIKKSIKAKLVQLQLEDDSDSYKEHMELKVPLVTFSDIVEIKPALTPYSSSDQLDSKPPSPPPRRAPIKRPRAPAPHHMYQSYFDNMVRGQNQARKQAAKIQQLKSLSKNNGSQGTTVLLLTSAQVEELSSLDNTLIDACNTSCKRHLRDDISQHPLGIPIKPPSRRSWFSIFDKTIHIQEVSSQSSEKNSTDIAFINGS